MIKTIYLKEGNILLTKKDLSERWGVSIRTVHRWMKDKNLPYLKIPVNNHIVFNMEDIEKWEKQYLNGKKD